MLGGVQVKKETREDPHVELLDGQIDDLRIHPAPRAASLSPQAKPDGRIRATQGVVPHDVAVVLSGSGALAL